MVSPGDIAARADGLRTIAKSSSAQRVELGMLRDEGFSTIFPLITLSLSMSVAMKDLCDTSVMTEIA